jgi:hypothetical protein
MPRRRRRFAQARARVTAQVEADGGQRQCDGT